jgi:6-phospho-3-hexuloisomerase
MSTSYKTDKKFTIREIIEAVMEENRSLVQRLSDKAAQDFIRRILDAGCIFFSAQGRAGFILRCFCMRLMHLGFTVYFCGETITPAITRDDLLIVLSGSGETPSTLESVKSAKKYHAKTYGILGNMESRIASIVDTSIHLPGTTKLCRKGEPHSLQMAGSLFEQSAFLFLEAIVLEIYQKRKKNVGSVSSRHTVIE